LDRRTARKIDIEECRPPSEHTDATTPASTARRGSRNRNSNLAALAHEIEVTAIGRDGADLSSARVDMLPKHNTNRGVPKSKDSFSRNVDRSEHARNIGISQRIKLRENREFVVPIAYNTIAVISGGPSSHRPNWLWSPGESVGESPSLSCALFQSRDTFENQHVRRQRDQSAVKHQKPRDQAKSSVD